MSRKVLDGLLEMPPPLRGDTALSLLQAVYRDPDLPLSTRMRAAAQALPFESPRLSAIANLSPEDFSDRLERAITRSEVRLIEVKGGKYKPLDQLMTRSYHQAGTMLAIGACRSSE
jgi:hypothetical protein